jgi:hypothetical protein
MQSRVIQNCGLRLNRCVYIRAALLAGVAKLADAPDLGSGAARHGGSSPSARTTKRFRLSPEFFLPVYAIMDFLHSRILAAMMPRLILLLLAISFASVLSAQFNDNAGGRSTAMAGAYVALNDGWSVFHNQAGLASVQSFDAGVYYENRFGLKALSDKGFFMAARIGKGVFAGSYHSFGYSEYASSKGGLAYAMGLGEKLDVGIQLNHYAVRLGENYGRAVALSAEGGFLYRLNSKLSLAAHISNPNRAKLSDYLDERIPSVFRMGGTYRFSKQVLLTTEVYKDTQFDPAIRTGLEYRITESVAVRGGFASAPRQLTFGFGWKLNQWMFDMAAAYHPVLGFNPHVSFTYSGNSEK